MMKSKAINDSERKWINDNLATLKALISSLDNSDGAVTPESLDIAYSAWFGAHQKGSEDPNLMINSFGIGYGSYLVDTLKMDWAVVKDQGRTELAVVGQPGDIVVFPANLVAKRYTKGDIGFFGFLYQEMKKTVVYVRSHPPPARPWWKVS